MDFGTQQLIIYLNQLMTIRLDCLMTVLDQFRLAIYHLRPVQIRPSWNSLDQLTTILVQLRSVSDHLRPVNMLSKLVKANLMTLLEQLMNILDQLLTNLYQPLTRNIPLRPFWNSLDQLMAILIQFVICLDQLVIILDH